jgi:WD40 repeat protein
LGRCGQEIAIGDGGHADNAIWLLYCVGDEQYYVDVWRWKEGTLVKYPVQPSPMDAHLYFVWLSEDRYAACFRTSDGASSWPLIVRNASSGHPLSSWKSMRPGWRVCCLSSSPNGKYLGMRSIPLRETRENEYSCLASIIDVTRTEVREIMAGKEERLDGCGEELAIGNDGRHLASWSSGRGPRIVDFKTKTVRKLDQNEDIEDFLCRSIFSPDCAKLYVACPGLAVVTVDVGSGKSVSRWYATKSGERDEYSSVAEACCTNIDVSSDGEYVAVGTADFGDAYVRSVKTGKVLRLVHTDRRDDGRLGSVFVAFSPDGQTVVTYTVKGCFRFWPRSMWAQ